MLYLLISTISFLIVHKRRETWRLGVNPNNRIVNPFFLLNPKKRVWTRLAFLSTYGLICSMATNICAESGYLTRSTAKVFTILHCFSKNSGILNDSSSLRDWRAISRADLLSIWLTQIHFHRSTITSIFSNFVNELKKLARPLHLKKTPKPIYFFLTPELHSEQKNISGFKSPINIVKAYTQQTFCGGEYRNIVSILCGIPDAGGQYWSTEHRLMRLSPTTFLLVHAMFARL